MTEVRVGGGQNVLRPKWAAQGVVTLPGRREQYTYISIWGGGGGSGQTYLWPNIQQQIASGPHCSPGSLCSPAVAVNEMSFAVLTRLANVAYTQHAATQNGPHWKCSLMLRAAALACCGCSASSCCCCCCCYLFGCLFAVCSSVCKCKILWQQTHKF